MSGHLACSNPGHPMYPFKILAHHELCPTEFPLVPSQGEKYLMIQRAPGPMLSIHCGCKLSGSANAKLFICSSCCLKHSLVTDGLESISLSPRCRNLTLLLSKHRTETSAVSPSRWTMFLFLSHFRPLPLLVGGRGRTASCEQGSCCGSAGVGKRGRVPGWGGPSGSNCSLAQSWVLQWLLQPLRVPLLSP